MKLQALIGLVCVLALASPAAAQGVAGTEVGFRGGLSRFSGDQGDGPVTVFSFPGSILPVVPMAYVTLFSRSGTAVEPQAGITATWSGGRNETAIAAGAQLMQFAKSDPMRKSSGFGFLNAGLVGGSSGGGVYNLGGGIGYRTVYRNALGVRVEGGYRRWFGEHEFGLNQIYVVLGLGAVLGSD